MAGDSKLPGAHFIIGGDGTHRGAYEMAELMKEKNWTALHLGCRVTHSSWAM